MATQKEDRKLVYTSDYSLMQVKSIAECLKEHSAILSTFIKLTLVFKTFVLSIFEWPLETNFTVLFMTILIFNLEILIVNIGITCFSMH